MSNIIPLHCLTTQHIPPDKVLQEAVGKLDDVLVVGRDKDGELYIAASFNEPGSVLLYMELAKTELLSYFS